MNLCVLHVDTPIVPRLLQIAILIPNASKPLLYPIQSQRGICGKSLYIPII